MALHKCSDKLADFFPGLWVHDHRQLAIHLWPLLLGLHLGLAILVPCLLDMKPTLQADSVKGLLAKAG